MRHKTKQAQALSTADAFLRRRTTPDLDDDVVEVGLGSELLLRSTSVERLGVQLDADAVVGARDDDSGCRVRSVVVQDLQGCALDVGAADHVVVADLLHDVLVAVVDGDGIADGGAEPGEEVLAKESLDLHRAATGLRLCQAPDSLRLEVEAVLVAFAPTVLHVRVSRDGAVVEARGRPIIVGALAAIALPGTQAQA